MLVVKGRWNEDRLRRFLHGQTGPDFIRPEIQWEELPQHLPQSVEVVLGDDSYFPLFPYRISYFRNGETGDAAKDMNIATIELYELNLNVDLTESVFRVNSESTQLDDVTPREVNRIRGLNDAMRAAEVQLPGNRKR